MRVERLHQHTHTRTHTEIFVLVTTTIQCSKRCARTSTLNSLRCAEHFTKTTHPPTPNRNSKCSHFASLRSSSRCVCAVGSVETPRSFSVSLRRVRNPRDIWPRVRKRADDQQHSDASGQQRSHRTYLREISLTECSADISSVHDVDNGDGADGVVARRPPSASAVSAHSLVSRQTLCLCVCLCKCGGRTVVKTFLYASSADDFACSSDSRTKFLAKCIYVRQTRTHTHT